MRADQLGVAARPAEGKVGEVDPKGAGADRVGNGSQPASKGRVDLTAELAPNDQVDHRGRQEDGHGNCHRRDEREAGTEGHVGSRRT